MFVINANLPQARLRTCLVGATYKSVIDDLLLLGIDTIKVERCEDLAMPVSNHADMLFYHQGGGNILAYHKCVDEIAKLSALGFNVKSVLTKLKPQYPQDILLNSASVGDYVFCNSAYTYMDILAGKKCINVKQGYAKCSTLVVSNSAIITADIGIYNGAVNNGFDALLIDGGDILLEGYESGFIGGCGTLIDKNTLYLTGKIDNHKNCKEITEFLNKHKIKPIFGKSEILVDVGSILGIIEN